MTAPFRPRHQDRPDIEAVPRPALDTPDIRSALGAETTGRTSARPGPLTDADKTGAASQEEYAPCLVLHAPAHESRDGRPASSGLLSALAVLTPAVAATAAAALLVLGFALQLAAAQSLLAGSLVTAGWILALTAAVSALIALVAVLTRAVRRHGGSARPARLEQGQRALPEQGMLPRLRLYLSETPSRPAAPGSVPPTDDVLPHIRRQSRRPMTPHARGSRMSINLNKGQQISLQKADGNSLTTVRMGLGWQAAPRKGFLAKLTGGGEIDLDASAILFAGGQPVDVVFFQHLTSDDGSVRHTGDNLTGGAGAGGDDESILVDLTRVPAHVDQIVFTVNSFTGQTFAEVQNAFCRLVDETTGTELARYTLTGGGRHTAQIMAKVRRGPGGWQMQAIGEPSTGRTFQDLLPTITPHL